MSEPIEIAIPEPDKDGGCNFACTFWGAELGHTFCRVQAELYPDSLGDAKPGPRCPGANTYVLVPKSEWKELGQVLLSCVTALPREDKKP